MKNGYEIGWDPGIYIPAGTLSCEHSGTVGSMAALNMPLCGNTTMNKSIRIGVTMTTQQRSNELSKKIIGSAIEVHKILGPGLLESAYEECLCYELAACNLHVKRQVPLPIVYKGVTLDCGFRLDLVVENSVIIELKSIEKLEPIHEAQLLTYLKLSNTWLGLLINFNVPLLRQGLKRLVMGS